MSDDHEDEEGPATLLELLERVISALEEMQSNRTKAHRVVEELRDLKPQLHSATEEQAASIESALQALWSIVRRQIRHGVLGDWFWARRLRSAFQSAEHELHQTLRVLNLGASEEQLSLAHSRENKRDASQDMQAMLNDLTVAAEQGFISPGVASAVRTAVKNLDSDAERVEAVVDASAAANDEAVGTFERLAVALLDPKGLGALRGVSIPGPALHLADPVEVVGEGTFCEVLRGEMDRGKSTRRFVAVKRVKSGATNVLLEERLALPQEAERWRAVSGHPNIVAFEGMCVKHDRLHLVMELCDMTLAKLLHHSPEIPEMDESHWSAILRGVARGLAHLHKHHIIHRDLKPANVFVNHKLGKIKIGDFGLATANARASLAADTVSASGTSQFMAPEVLVVPARWTRKADMYAFGVLGWEVLHREEAWKGATTQFLIRAVRDEGKRLPFHPNLVRPQWMFELIESCCDADARRRPSASKALREIKLYPNKGRRSTRIFRALVNAVLPEGKRLSVPQGAKKK